MDITRFMDYCVLIPRAGVFGGKEEGGSFLGYLSVSIRPDQTPQNCILELNTICAIYF